MARHRDLAAATGVRVYSATARPWQRAGCENTNALRHTAQGTACRLHAQNSNAMPTSDTAAQR